MAPILEIHAVTETARMGEHHRDFASIPCSHDFTAVDLPLASKDRRFGPTRCEHGRFRFELVCDQYWRPLRVVDDVRERVEFGRMQMVSLLVFVIDKARRYLTTFERQCRAIENFDVSLHQLSEHMLFQPVVECSGFVWKINRYIVEDEFRHLEMVFGVQAQC